MYYDDGKEEEEEGGAEKKNNRFLRRVLVEERADISVSILFSRFFSSSSSSFKCSITRLLSYDDIKLVRLANWKMAKRTMNDENADYSRVCVV